MSKPPEPDQLSPDGAIEPLLEPTLSHYFIHGVLQGAIRRGHDPYLLFEQAGLAPTLLDDPKARINGEAFNRLMNTIIGNLNDLYYGFSSEIYKPILNSAVIKETLGCQTLGESIRARTEFREALRDDVHYDFTVDIKTQEFSLSVGDFELVEGVDAHLFYWVRLCTIYRYQSWLIGKRIKLNRVDFATPAPACGEEHLALFHTEVNFDQPQNRLMYDKRYLSYPIVRTDDEIKGNDFAIDFPDWLQVPGRDQSVTRQVEQVLKAFQEEGDFHPGIEVVAEQLRVNKRTLRTQLARENENFQHIKSEVRKAMAIKYLIATDKPVALVSLDLGFVEPGDFSRNFKRWTGYSPTDYRIKFGGRER